MPTNMGAQIGKKSPFTQGRLFFIFIYDLSIFMTSTALMDTKAKYGITLSRYTVFLKIVLYGTHLFDFSFLAAFLFLTLAY